MIVFFRNEGTPHTREISNFIESSPNSLAGPGEIANEVESSIAKIIGTNKVLLTPSGTAALEMAALLLDIKLGDEIIMPSWTFASTANAFILRGATIVFVDVELNTLNMDPVGVENAITPRTKCIVTINYGGLPGNLEKFKEIADLNDIYLVEDNAHGFGGAIRGRALGSFGNLSAMSFHQTKNLQCGEGGAISLNDETFIARSEVLREKGTNRSEFYRGVVDKYTWQDIGSSFVISEILAKYLELNLKIFQETQNRRASLWKIYDEAVANLKIRYEVKGPKISSDWSPAYHLYWLLFPTSKMSEDFTEHLKVHEIATARHYVPLHSSPAAKRFPTRHYDSMANTNATGLALVRLPFYSKLLDSEIEKIVFALEEFKQ